MNTRTLVCTAIGLLVLAFLFMLTPKPVYLPHGIVLPEKVVRAPITDNQVAIFQAAPNGNYQRLGEVRVEMAYQILDTETRDRLFAYVKSLNAQVGANGVVINMLASGENLRPTLTFIGTAIFIPRSM